MTFVKAMWPDFIEGYHHKIIAEKFRIPKISIDLSEWKKTTTADFSNRAEINICIVGKYIELHDSYMSVIEAIKHAGMLHKVSVNIKWVSAESIEIDKPNLDNLFNNVNGFIVPGGFDPRGVEGMILTANFAREKKIPYLGLCLGMQIMVIEFTRNVPLILQIILWYAILIQLPRIKQAPQIWESFYISNRGLFGPKPIFEEGFNIVFYFIILSFVIRQ